MSESFLTWEELARKLGTLRENSELGGTDPAVKALDVIFGETFFKEAVEWCIQGNAGSELARSVLQHLGSNFALEYCYSIYKTDPDTRRKEEALYLIKALADHRVLKWIPEILSEKKSTIRAMGINILDQFYFRNPGFSEEVEQLAKIVQDDEDRYTRKFARHLLDSISKADKRQKILEEAAKNDPTLLESGFNATDED